MFGKWLAALTALPAVWGLKWAEEEVGYNINENQAAVQPTDYWGEWHNHQFNPSPKTWRFPFYVLTMDRYVDGDPTNNEANGTVFEHHWMANQFRFGGDPKGLQGDLDYIQGLGIKAIYLTGSPFLNMPWSGDGYGPLDFTLLDRHHGSIDDWRSLITEIHRREMYVVFDNTIATMGNLLGAKESLNSSVPFSWNEYDYVWKDPNRRYHDFQPGNAHNASCVYPRMWGQDGLLLSKDITDQMNGCRASEFDMYGDIKGTGAYPSYQSQLSKFASVQDRLREWQSNVMDKIKVMSCMQIAMFDIDGFRIDKALQVTPDAMASWSSYQRECARKYGKDNFLVVGEVVGDPKFASVYFGRGKQLDQEVFDLEAATRMNNDTDPKLYIREFGETALDGAAFHYDIYGSMTRFLGLDGPWGAYGVDWVELWNRMLRTNDMVSAATGQFDPRHIFGMTGQDVFRWPALANGTERQLLGFFVVYLELPGIPMTFFGEEQDYYVLENLAADYVFGRMPMASARAWQLHGCYGLGEDVYVDMPFDRSGRGCHDDEVSLDHRNVAHPIRNVIKRMLELRRQYPVLNDGFNLTTLSTKVYDIWLPGSGGLPSPHGIWSVYRGRTEGVQDFSGTGQGNQGVWFVFHNENRTLTYDFDCKSTNTSKDLLIAPYPSGTTVKNLFYPYDEVTLEDSQIHYNLEDSNEANGCLSKIELPPWGYKAMVPKEAWVNPGPSITRTIPGHDQRLKSTVGYFESETVPIEIRFNREMNCNSVVDNLYVTSKTQTGKTAQLDKESVKCQVELQDLPTRVGEVASNWTIKADLINVYNGVHMISVTNVSTEDGFMSTNTNDRFFFRIGQEDNPMVFPTTSNYTRGLLSKDSGSGDMYISPRASGADKIRYSTNWGTSFSNWQDYTGEKITITEQPWAGTKKQKWVGHHVIVHYWSQMTGSADHVQHADLDRLDKPPRRFPHVFMEGDWNMFGYDGGLENSMKQDSAGLWRFNLIAEWPNNVVVNVWGMNPDGFPDKSAAYGDIDGDHILDWVPPDTLASNVINMTKAPPKGYLGYQVVVNDGNWSYEFVPVGSAAVQAVISVFLGLIPLLTGILAVWLFMKSFYQVKFNQIGVAEKSSFLGFLRPKLPQKKALRTAVADMFGGSKAARANGLAVETGSPIRRTVLIATMEYEIEDWPGVKIKIGGLGVMASLMGKNLGHQNLIWVVPCVGGIDYPTEPDDSTEPAPPMVVTVLGIEYNIAITYHQVRNITYVLLDAPVFRKQSKGEPYPARMDDLESAIYYSVWNQCIAQAITRFNVDLYHINDYHGAVAPLHLLPEVIPCCLSLHNAEFQGLWPVRNPTEMEETCLVYNLPKAVVEKYVQFGEVFNLLHAGASYIRVHQTGFGAVGVSKKYGKRSLMRYPIFWGLRKIGSLPNPDPTDTAEWDGQLPKQEGIVVDEALEAKRGDLRKEAQQWAGLNVDPNAELFVFVGRWSMQKGVDLIADVFFSVLAENPRTQLICVGPVIDLYGKFAALKLEKMMEKFPGRVFSKPQFTVLPPCVFSGAEFALIPSRDEPFGLVAVEFGRKGALGVGARVGGLGQMPGWWYTIESTTTKHLTQQFKSAIRSALASKQDTRAMMRARSLVQRFPVAQWIEDLEKLQQTSIQISQKEQQSALSRGVLRYLGDVSGLTTPVASAPNSRPGSRNESRANSPLGSHFGTPTASKNPTPSGLRSMSPAPSRPMTPSQETGPGHGRQNSDEDDRQEKRRSRARKRLTKTPPMSRATSVGSVSELEQRVHEDQDQREAELRRIVESYEDNSRHSRQRSSSGSRRRLSKFPPSSYNQYQHTDEWDLEDDPRHNRKRSSSGAPSRRAPQRTRSGNDRPSDRPNSEQWDLEDNLTEDRKRSSSGPARPRHPQRSLSGTDSQRTVRETQGISRSNTSATLAASNQSFSAPFPQPPSPAPMSRSNSFFTPPFAPSPSMPGTPTAEDGLMEMEQRRLNRRLSMNSIIGDQDSKKDFMLQKVDPFFTDSSNHYYDNFSRKLEGVDAKNSETTLCIEEYLVKSEKQWFSDFHRAKLGMSSPGSSTSSVFRLPWGDRDDKFESPAGSRPQTPINPEEFNLSADYVAPNGLKRLLQRKIGDWQLYCFLLAFGQIIAANSYQVSLLTGEYGRADVKLYVVAAIYLAASVLWWYLFRRFKAVYVLSVPFIIYALAFFVLGLGRFASGLSTEWIFNVASGLYAIASASGSLYFALNFGTEGGTPTQAWAFRACVIQGTQQLYVAFLWYWGNVSSSSSNQHGLVTSSAALAGVCWPIAILMFAIGVVLYLGLPNYYRQRPGKVPSFYSSLFRRKIVVWFFIMVIIQNYFLSAPYNRNWRYLWSSQHASKWAIFLLILVFFVGVWGLGLYFLGMLSKKHSWLFPVFAIGLGAPRWAQMLWGTSNLGFYVPWGSLASGALLGRSLWLWLGVLDALQGVGFGMMLLQTLTRFHIAFVLIAAQVIGSITTILARATAPNRIGPGDVFPDFAVDYGTGLGKGWFWTALILQLVICVGFLTFFRKEQLFKP